MDSGTLQEMIHINLTLLELKGHTIDFEEGMFQERNLPGFEKVAYGLSVVISSEEAKKSIPWPLLGEKKLRNEFRLKFCKFIKTVNMKYDAKIPELSASNLQYPGGQMFLNFMYRLSSFAMELELLRMMSPEEKGKLLQRYNTCKSEDQEVCIKICLGHRYAEEEKMQEHDEYQDEALAAITEMEESSKILEDAIKSTQPKLQSSLAGSDIDEVMKNRLMDISCNNAMEAWNQRTELRIKELKQANERLVQISELTSRVTQMIRESADNQKGNICLDGSTLKTTHSFAKFTNAPVRSNRGDVKLETIFEAGLAAANRLHSCSSPQPSQLPWARELESEVLAQSQRARKCSAALDKLESTCETEIAEIRPVLFESVRNIERPEWFSCLRSTPLIPIVLPSEPRVSPIKGDRKRRFPGVLKSHREKKKKTMNVRTSFKLKRLSFHPSMTPSLQHHRPKACSTALRVAPVPSATSCIPRAFPSIKKSRTSLSTLYQPSCRKSLYGKLPTGKKPIEENDSQDLSGDLEFPPLATSQGFTGNVESNTFGLLKTDQNLQQEKLKRRSIDLVIERYRQLKIKQSESVIKSQCLQVIE